MSRRRKRRILKQMKARGWDDQYYDFLRKDLRSQGYSEQHIDSIIELDDPEKFDALFKIVKDHDEPQ